LKKSSYQYLQAGERGSIHTATQHVTSWLQPCRNGKNGLRNFVNAQNPGCSRCSLKHKLF